MRGGIVQGIGPDGNPIPIQATEDGELSVTVPDQDNQTDNLLRRLIVEVGMLRWGMIAAGTCKEINAADVVPLLKFN